MAKRFGLPSCVPGSGSTFLHHMVLVRFYSCDRTALPYLSALKTLRLSAFIICLRLASQVEDEGDLFIHFS